MNWTDDKHNLYLDSLERSFVDQLNHSSRMHVLIWEDTEAPYLSPKLSMENCASFDEVWHPQGISNFSLLFPRYISSQCCKMVAGRRLTFKG